MSIYFEEHGKKTSTTIVFVHGGGMSGWMWERQLENFKDYHCIVPDLPEHGRNQSGGKISIKNNAKQIAEMIEKHANGGNAYLVGHSLGAKVIVELLRLKPEVVKGAILASALFRPVPFMKLTHNRLIYKITTAMLKKTWIRSTLIKQYKFPNKIYFNNCIKEFKELSSETFYRIYDELYENINLPKELKGVNVPVLVIAGEKEFRAMRQSVVDLIKILPNSKGILIKNGLHTYPWAMYKNFNNIIEHWIQNRTIKDTGTQIVLKNDL
jgi:pimeloyl-ACP methyl ester carboxylesterase